MYPFSSSSVTSANISVCGSLPIATKSPSSGRTVSSPLRLFLTKTLSSLVLPFIFLFRCLTKTRCYERTLTLHRAFVRREIHSVCESHTPFAKLCQQPCALQSRAAAADRGNRFTFEKAPSQTAQYEMPLPKSSRSFSRWSGRGLVPTAIIILSHWVFRRQQK